MILFLVVISESQASGCNLEWFGAEDSIFFSINTTSPELIKKINIKTRKILSHEYAKDKNFVYFKPTPNRDNTVVILQGADSASFKVLKGGSGKARDKSYIFKFNKVIKKLDQ